MKVFDPQYISDLERQLEEIEKLQSVAKKFRDNLRVKRHRLLKTIESVKQLQQDYEMGTDLTTEAPSVYFRRLSDG